MTATSPIVAAMLALAAGTFLLRLAGPALRARVRFPPPAEHLLEASAVVLLAGLLAVSACFEGHSPAGPARLLGVLTGALLAWRRAPFLAVVLGAATTTALLRLLGLN
ncbi:AzlD domain-containing protein [Yinghuangia aomiensis]|uniref:AzlD domain-containing protein n=1 Tax=Yinghuangia aomiensis TaxID=676205 RepID=A0ABP9I6N3_9ACTN